MSALGVTATSVCVLAAGVNIPSGSPSISAEDARKQSDLAIVSSTPASGRSLKDTHPEAYKKLVDLLGDRLVIDDGDREDHGHDRNSYHSAGAPGAVACLSVLSV